MRRGGARLLTDAAAWEQVVARCQVAVPLPGGAPAGEVERARAEHWVASTRGLAQAQVAAAEAVRARVYERGRSLSEVLAKQEGRTWCRAAFLHHAAQARAEGALGLPGPIPGGEPWRQGPAQIEDLMTPEELAQACKSVRGPLRAIAGGRQ